MTATLVLVWRAHVIAQVVGDTVITDSSRSVLLDDVVITASRVTESYLASPVSMELIRSSDLAASPAPTAFDALESARGVQVITPSLAFKVINTRGFSNTTNVRFAQLVDGVDNQAPHIGAPVGNGLGASELDIDRVEIIPGIASALYGMNAVNGMVNIHTKDPFLHQGLSLQQSGGLNHLGNAARDFPALLGQSHVRYARAFDQRWAFKVNGSFLAGTDWQADDRSDMAAHLNESVGMTGSQNPGMDEVNSYGNESPNRQTLTLGGLRYVVARTGYRESELTDYKIRNVKGDGMVAFRPASGHELAFQVKGAMLNNVYQRSNRFELKAYQLQQYSFSYRAPFLQVRSYVTHENTGKSYNLRSLAENMDRAFKSDQEWFQDYKSAFEQAEANGLDVAAAHQAARVMADSGRYVPGTVEFKQKAEELSDINNWDQGAALRVRSWMAHAEAFVSWDKVFPKGLSKLGLQLLSGVDRRNYVIIPDGNYFINPTDTTRNLHYGKTGLCIQATQSMAGDRLKLGATLRADKSDYFDWKLNPRLTAAYSPATNVFIRAGYQSGYRFPSIFEGFSNVVSGGVKRVGGLRVMSEGIFENSYTKASIDAFKSKVDADVNLNGMVLANAIEANKDILKKNPYTYLKPEFVQTVELGVRGLLLKERLFFDLDVYYSSYRDFIAQMEANIPKTSDQDSIPYFLYDKSKQDRYRLWTNSQTRITTFGVGAGLKYHVTKHLDLGLNTTMTDWRRAEDGDGLEDGFNTPKWIFNGSFSGIDLWQGIDAGVAVRWQSRFEYVSFLVEGEVPAYWTLDAQITCPVVQHRLDLKLGATNLLNRPYYSMLGGGHIGGFYYATLTVRFGD